MKIAIVGLGAASFGVAAKLIKGHDKIMETVIIDNRIINPF